MSKPSIAELSKNNKYNRYTLVMAAAKGARYVIAKENYEKEHPQNDMFGFNLNKPDIDYNDKPVKNAIKMFHDGDMMIKLPPEAQQASEDHMAQCAACAQSDEDDGASAE